VYYSSKVSGDAQRVGERHVAVCDSKGEHRELLAVMPRHADRTDDGIEQRLFAWHSLDEIAKTVYNGRVKDSVQFQVRPLIAADADRAAASRRLASPPETSRAVGFRQRLAPVAGARRLRRCFNRLVLERSIQEKRHA